MDMELSQPVDAALLKEWADLYTAQVLRMPRGRNLAAAYRKSVLAPGSQHGLLVWRKDEKLACGCVVEFNAERSALVVRFSAVAADYRDWELPRAMYVTLADMAAERGMRWITLGSDVNFYGAMVSPGLCAYKLRLGFLPVPADLFGIAASRTVAERITSTSGLQPPVLRFEYRRTRPQGAGVDDFVAGPDALRLVSVMAPDDTSEILESLPEHRRLVMNDRDGSP
jgi:hypothetical protein